MSRLFKVIGALLVVAALITALLLPAAVEHSELQYKSGKIDSDGVLSDGEIIKCLSVFFALTAAGGILYGIGYIIDVPLYEYEKGRKRR